MTDFQHIIKMTAQFDPTRYLTAIGALFTLQVEDPSFDFDFPGDNKIVVMGNAPLQLDILEAKLTRLIGSCNWKRDIITRTVPTDYEPAMKVSVVVGPDAVTAVYKYLHTLEPINSTVVKTSGWNCIVESVIPVRNTLNLAKELRDLCHGRYESFCMEFAKWVPKNRSQDSPCKAA